MNVKRASGNSRSRFRGSCSTVAANIAFPELLDVRFIGERKVLVELRDLCFTEDQPFVDVCIAIVRHLRFAKGIYLKVILRIEL